jgi:hypothetical protein
MKHLKAYLAALTLLIGLGAVFAIPANVAMADPKSTVCNTLGAGGGCGSQPSNGISINGVIAATINIFSAVVGVVAVIMIIVGGFRYITSNGDSGRISAAKSTIIYAIVGLIVVALAQVIVQFVLHKVT